MKESTRILGLTGDQRHEVGNSLGYLRSLWMKPGRLRWLTSREVADRKRQQAWRGDRQVRIKTPPATPREGNFLWLRGEPTPIARGGGSAAAIDPAPRQSPA